MYCAITFGILAIIAFVVSGAPCTLRCDGTDDTSALQQALIKCDLVSIPENVTCQTLPLTIQSHTILDVRGLLQSMPRSEWPVKDRTIKARPLLSATSAVNVTLRGTGRIDGRGSDWWHPLYELLPRPRLITLTNVTNAEVADLTLTNPAFWTMLIGGSDFFIHDVTIRAPNWGVAPNTDGIDVAATNVLIQRVDISNGDDSICIKSPSSNVLVEDSIVRQGNGFVVGTAGSGLDGAEENLYDVRNITFRNSVAIDTTFGCHIKARDTNHGTAVGIAFENITITQTINATKERLKHHDHAGYAIGIHLLDQGRRRALGESLSAIKVKAINVTYRNIQADAVYAGEFKCGDAQSVNCAGIAFENVHLNVSAGGCIFDGIQGTAVDVTPASCANL